MSTKTARKRLPRVAAPDEAPLDQGVLLELVGYNCRRAFLIIGLAVADMALDAARSLGLTSGFGKAKSARHLRDYLRGVAADIAQQHPDFSMVWDQVLSRELADDEPTEQEVA